MTEGREKRARPMPEYMDLAMLADAVQPALDEWGVGAVLRINRILGHDEFEFVAVAVLRDGTPLSASFKMSGQQMMSAPVEVLSRMLVAEVQRLKVPLLEALARAAVGGRAAAEEFVRNGRRPRAPQPGGYHFDDRAWRVDQAASMAMVDELLKFKFSESWGAPAGPAVSEPEPIPPMPSEMFEQDEQREVAS